MTLIRKNVTVLIKGDHIECWGSLKKACIAHPELVYNTLTKMKMPLDHKGFKIFRVPFNEKK